MAYRNLSPLCKCFHKGPLIQFFRRKSTIRRIDKVLIANRGEIACRVIRTARRLGVRTVAVYSEADKDALHVSMKQLLRGQRLLPALNYTIDSKNFVGQFENYKNWLAMFPKKITRMLETTLANEAYCIGPPPAAESYLRGDKLLEVAKVAQCQAIHPGYGFLSENVEFAENCQKHNVIFIGPPASAIRDMGIKSTSKHIMSNAGVPVIEGYHGEDQSNETLKSEARRIGFPIMIKAVRGGGGKGMRIAQTDEEFESALESARTESQKAFGDSVVLLEKFVAEPRHVEVQVFADMHDNAVHLYERDCSVQRRHQKIIEEAPAPGLSNDLRQELGAAAVRAAKAVGYVGAGTVEFILDRKTHSFHFMEMNTRLQVEHPITEMVTGTDLVEWQLKIASGEKLPVQQKDITLNGHAFEARIYAEDPRGGFLPGAGPLLHLTTPKASEDVRIETGVRQGDEVSVHYDPMIAKLVVWSKNRKDALSKLRSNLLEYHIAGVETNVNFLLDLAKHPEFEAGNVHTNFITDYYNSLFKDDSPSTVQIIQAALASILKDEMEESSSLMTREDQYNPFFVESNYRINHWHTRDLKMKFKENDIAVKIMYVDGNAYRISLDSGATWTSVTGKLSFDNGNQLVLTSSIEGYKSKISVFNNCDILSIFDDNGKTEFSLEAPSYLADSQHDTSAAQQNRATAPMPGIIDKILVKTGDFVRKGDSLFVLIAMKMEYVVKANRDAKVSNIVFKTGDNVPKDATIVQFDEKTV